ncbi:TPA: polyprenyl synthetase family protein, partial [Streptococcus pyogenes]|nr:polyprenyl synthetase family protein [Streptococcus pyogenes]
LEMIHTGSLIHDDLPAMDNDDYRRGRLTNHKQFGEATAILAGDSLFLDPFGLIAQAELNSEVKVALIQELSLASGTFGMVGGQMLDMKGENQALSLPQLSLIHLNKTGKLLAFPFKAAALITEQAMTVRQQLEQAGMLIGHAFQIRDDIL